jgi:hypothetical protein
MGYRHNVISDDMVPRKDKLPGWFVTKWGPWMDLDGPYWASYTERKRYQTWAGLDLDIQQLCVELKLLGIQLVYYASEDGAIVRTTITPARITEDRLEAGGW